MNIMIEASSFQMFVYYKRCSYISCPMLPIHQMWSFSHIITVGNISAGEVDTSLLRNIWSIHLLPTLCSQKLSLIAPYTEIWVFVYEATVYSSYFTGAPHWNRQILNHTMVVGSYFILCGWENTTTAPPISSSLIWLLQWRLVKSSYSKAHQNATFFFKFHDTYSL
jgi:hypothetical protein